MTPFVLRLQRPRYERRIPLLASVSNRTFSSGATGNRPTCCRPVHSFPPSTPFYPASAVPERPFFFFSSQFTFQVPPPFSGQFSPEPTVTRELRFLFPLLGFSFCGFFSFCFFARWIERLFEVPPWRFFFLGCFFFSTNGFHGSVGAALAVVDSEHP